MKKLIFLLLCTVSFYGQTLQNPTYGTVTEKTTTTDNTPAYFVTSQTDGVHKKTPAALIEKTANKSDSYTASSSTTYASTKALVDGLGMKANDANVVHKIGNETVAGNKTLSGTTTLNETIIREGYRLIFPSGVMYQSSVGSNSLTGNRTVSFPDASGTVALVSQTVTDGVTTSSPSQDAVYDFVTANAVTLGTTNGLSLSGQQISLGLSSTSTIGALSSTDWNVFNNKQNNLVSGTNIKTLEGQSLLGSGNIDLAKSDVGLSNVDNTSDANKPVSTAQQTALDLKENLANKQNSLAVDGTGTKYPTVDAVKTYADVLDSGNIHTSGNDTKSGNLYFSNGGVASGVITTITPTVSGQACRIAYLSDTNITEPKTLVLYFHGSSETQDTPFTGLGKNITDKLISEGYIVAASFAAGNAWGNQDSQDDYYDLYAHIKGLYNINKVVFIGQSMGGLTSLNLLASNRITKCYAWYGVYPVTNLNEAYFNEGFASAIETAYGFVGSGNYAAATAGFDPQIATTSLFAEKTYDMTSSPDDTLIFKTTNSDLFKTKINSVAFRATVIQASGAHGDASHFLPNNVISSFDYFATNSVGTAGYIGKFGNYKDIFNSDIFQNHVNIGIGTVSPARKVHIKDNLGFYEVLRLESIASEAVIEMKDFAGVLTTFGTVLGDFYIGTPLIKHLTINRSTGNATFTGTIKATSFNGSATLTGTPTAPTAAPGTNTTQIATTAFVQAAKKYKTYIGILNQSSTSAPTVTVINNELSSAIVWTYSSVGGYVGTLIGAFTNNKTSINFTNGQAGNGIYGSYRLSDNAINITSSNSTTGVASDGMIWNATIEIRVYN